VLAAANADPVNRAKRFGPWPMRCEESPWFGTAYLGSRLMLGLSTLDEIGDLGQIRQRESRCDITSRHLGYPRTGEGDRASAQF
jgi:N-carbamoyl-L-amino-acid hydrolase